MPARRSCCVAGVSLTWLLFLLIPSFSGCATILFRGNELLFYSKFSHCHPVAMPDSFSADGLRRIHRLAWIVRALCLLGVAIIGTLPFIFWAQPDWVAEVAAKTWNLRLVQLDLRARLLGLAASMLPTSVSLFALWQMWALFGCFAQGELLARRPAQHLRRLGLGLCALAAAQPLGQTFGILALTFGNPKGERQLSFALSSDHYLALLFGLLLLALAQVLHEAARVADENAEFI
ncbi:MAG: DUF2975 domain-containing protein [Rubrivivax sp.]|nr:MAG: DUF2975 domain-containing protein [Rubrivivax sp.]